LLPQSDDEEKQQSNALQRATGANLTYIYREGHTSIQSEIDNANQDN
jgi:hypothetical protein